MDFTPEIELLYMLFERWCTKNRKISLIQRTRYFNFRGKIQLDHPVQFRALDRPQSLQDHPRLAALLRRLLQRHAHVVHAHRRRVPLDAIRIGGTGSRVKQYKPLIKSRTAY